MKDIDLYPSYDYESFSVNNGVTDEECWPSAAELTLAGNVKITTDKDISVKFSSTNNVAYPLAAADSPLEVDDLAISKIYISNSSGNTATVTVFILGE